MNYQLSLIGLLINLTKLALKGVQARHKKGQ